MAEKDALRTPAWKPRRTVEWDVSTPTSLAVHSAVSLGADGYPTATILSHGSCTDAGALHTVSKDWTRVRQSLSRLPQSESQKRMK